MNIWNTFLIQPLTTLLLFLYSLLGGNIGLAIIALTIILRVVLFPLSLPALRSAKAQQKLKPKLEKLKKKHKDNPQELARAQLELFRQAGVNPFAGCLPQILQIVILIALYNVLIGTLNNGDLNTQFLFWNLAYPDPYIALPILAAAAQFLLARATVPSTKGEREAAKATKEQADDLASAMQRQNLYLFPILTIVIGFKLPAGLLLYWFVSSLLQFGQRWWVTRDK
jgi:YidC/Oxa1 family membrane protein insertase